MAYWAVSFVGGDAGIKSKKKRKEVKAVDEGGVTRQFLDHVWNQLGALHVYREKDKKKYLLFELTESELSTASSYSGGFSPVKDAMIPSELHDTARKYYRAIGRIMFHSLVTHHPICSIAMPLFFRNIIFRGIYPGDEKYRDTDVFDHLVQITSFNLKGMIGQPLELFNGIDRGGLVTEDNLFKEAIPSFFVESRKLAIDALIEGVTLNGKVKVQTIFRIMPLKVVTTLGFSNPKITADDLIAVLKRAEQEFAQFAKESLRSQKMFFEETLKNVLRASDESFLKDFVSFTTGLKFLPCEGAGNPRSVILIEFSHSNEEQLPYSHTCDNAIVFPCHAYNCSEEMLKSKLEKSFELSNKGFDMN